MTAIETLRKAAKGSEDFDEDRARSDIEAATDKYQTASRYSVFHEDQLRPRDAVKALKPILGLLQQLGKRMDAMDEGRWRDWSWIAADVYCDIPEVREDLVRWNAELAKEHEKSDWDPSDYAVSEVDQVGRDLDGLRNIVAKVEPRFRAVVDAMTTTKGKEGRPALGARNSLFRNLRVIYERDTGKKATARSEKSEHGADGPFVDFVVTVNREIRPPILNPALGTAVRNSLYPPKTKGSKGV